MRNVLDWSLADSIKDTYVLIGLDAVVPCAPELWLSRIDLRVVRRIIRLC